MDLAKPEVCRQESVIPQDCLGKRLLRLLKLPQQHIDLADIGKRIVRRLVEVILEGFVKVRESLFILLFLESNLAEIVVSLGRVAIILESPTKFNLRIGQVMHQVIHMAQGVVYFGNMRIEMVRKLKLPEGRLQLIISEIAKPAIVVLNGHMVISRGDAPMTCRQSRQGQKQAHGQHSCRIHPPGTGQAKASGLQYRSGKMS